MLNTIDLFCGAGGLSYGFYKAGYNIIAGIDNNAEALETYKINHPKSLTIKHDLTKSLIHSNLPEFNIIKKEKVFAVIGGPPCQGMSIAGKRIPDDPRNQLFKAYLEIIEYFNPEVIVLENVPTINSLFNGAIADAIISSFSEHGYNISNKTITISDYGIPQKRKRTFFVGLKNKTFTFPKETTKESPVTTFEALSDLPLLDEDPGEYFIEYTSKPQSDYQKLMRIKAKGIFNHIAVIHTEKTKKIISLVPDGGNYKDLPKNLQETRKVHIAWTRMNSSKPCFTIDAGHNHHFHYKANRVPTVRECARIQSFPDNFIFTGKKTSQYRQVGNAVPPLFAEMLAKEIRRQLNV